VSLTVMG